MNWALGFTRVREDFKVQDTYVNWAHGLTRISKDLKVQSAYKY